MPVINDVVSAVDAIAPFDLAEEYDNVGLLCGQPWRNVDKILVALDLTTDVVAEAVACGAQLIVTHHPTFFHARKNLVETNAEAIAVSDLIRASLGHIAAHTNFDNACPGVNDALSHILGLEEIEECQHGIRIGILPERLDIVKLCRYVEQRLDTRVRLYGTKHSVEVQRIAVLGGAGGSFFAEALKNGADVFITGEVHHHEALDAVAQGLHLIEAGHYETEKPGVKLLAEQLAAEMDRRQMPVEIIESQTIPFKRYLK